jgi:alcohol dehydrogenase
MMSAAAMGAVAFQKGLGAIHALSHPVGAVYNTHHGMTNAVVMPPVLRMNRPAIEERIAGLRPTWASPAVLTDFTITCSSCRADLGVPDKLAELGVGRDRIDEMTAMALEDPSAGGNPVKMTSENTKALFEACI